MLMGRKDGKWALLVYMLIDRHAKERDLDMNVLRGAAVGTSDLYLVEARVKMLRGFGKEEMM